MKLNYKIRKYKNLYQGLVFKDNGLLFETLGYATKEMAEINARQIIFNELKELDTDWDSIVIK